MLYFAVALILGSALAFIGAGEVHAGAWCSWYDPYTYNCGFRTLEQCQANISGMGGYCARNLNEPQTAPRQRRRQQSGAARF